MACEPFERRILEYLDNTLPSPERAVVEAHWTVCSECRVFADQLQRLDASLAHRLQCPTLSSGFTERLTERIRAEVPFLSEAERAERKRRWQGEFEAARSKLSREAFAVGNLSNMISSSLAIGLAGLILFQLTLPLTNRLLAQSPGAPWVWLAPSLIASAVFLLIGLSAAFPRRFRMALTSV